MPSIRQFSESKVVFDDRYSPLLISTFYGKADLEAAQWHDKVHQEAVREASQAGLRVVTISDATSSTRPGPDVRKFWAESMAQAHPEIRAAVLGTFVVMNSPLLRGVLTAIGWLNERARSIETFGTLAEALVEAQARLDKENLKPRRTLDPYDYRLPEIPTEKAG